MPSSRIFYETFRHPLYPENEKKNSTSLENPFGAFLERLRFFTTRVDNTSGLM